MFMCEGELLDFDKSFKFVAAVQGSRVSRWNGHFGPFPCSLDASIDRNATRG
jgi:hypothetical protein